MAGLSISASGKILVTLPREHHYLSYIRQKPMVFKERSALSKPAMEIAGPFSFSTNSVRCFSADYAYQCKDASARRMSLNKPVSLSAKVGKTESRAVKALSLCQALVDVATAGSFQVMENASRHGSETSIWKYPRRGRRIHWFSSARREECSRCEIRTWCVYSLVSYSESVRGFLQPPKQLIPIRTEPKCPLPC